MKHLILVLIILAILPISDSLFSQGINFKPITIREGVKLAKTENKNLFVLFGTTHCGYSQISFNELYRNKACGDYFNEHFICIGYGDSTTINLNKWYHSTTRVQYNLMEDEIESVLCNYFIYPNYFFFNKHGEIVYINAAPKKPKKLLKYARSVSNGKVKTPFLFRFKFNNKMYPKNKSTYKMLTHCLNAYVLMDVPTDINYKIDSIWNVKDFKFDNNNLEKARDKIETSLKYNEYYFNCFLASIIYYKSGNFEKAVYYARKGLNDFPKHWDDSRKLSDKLMNEILNHKN
jgi:thioredoxin-related protein